MRTDFCHEPARCSVNLYLQFKMSDNTGQIICRVNEQVCVCSWRRYIAALTEEWLRNHL
jgi:hypothetical protein